MSEYQEEVYTGSEIAIIGMAGRFPGAADLETFWRNLRDGVESIARLTDEELLAAGVDPQEWQQPNYVKAAPTLAEIESFDAPFFGFSPLEAEITDPQQRIFMECVWEALENGGYNPETYADAIGVFAGSRTNTYVFNLVSDQQLFRSLGVFQISVGNDLASLATRVSYKLNLKGPSYAVHTACSTSLVAIHLACQSLLIDECQMAIAGGVAVNVPHTVGYLYEPGGVLAPDGHCRAFDKDAQGTVFGSGAGAVLLKRLEDALADGDTIHAVIKGSATNNDGAGKASFTAPSVDGQAEVIIEAMAEAEVRPETISYVEAHGTGTALGDPIEVRALTKAFRAGTSQKSYCAIGSVKTNVGHLDAAAGMSSLLKTVLALKHQQIPPSLNFTQPNPRIDFANSPFYVNTKLQAWSRGDGPRRAGVSSFGFGGTNAHLIVEEAPEPIPSDPAGPWQLLLLSALTPTALDTMTDNLQRYFATHPDDNLADVAYTLQVGRKELPHRRMIVVNDRQGAEAALRARDPEQVIDAETTVSKPPVAFLFPGQGAQTVGMGREIYAQEPVFRATVDHCCAVLAPHLGLDLRTVLYPAPEQTAVAAAQLQQTALAQPALFVVAYALAQLWQHWGVQPAALLGHSLGEVVAATLAGVFTLEDALALVAERGRLMQTCAPGALLSVALPAADLDALLGPDLSLAALNTPTQTVVAGPEGTIEQLRVQLERADIRCRRLPTSHAFHSPAMEPILPAFRAAVARVARHAPQRPFLSNVTGAWITAAEATDPDYWTQQLRQPVRFAAGLQALAARGAHVALEVGPGTTLSAFARQQPGATTVLSSLPHPNDQRSDLEILLGTLGKLWLHGVTPEWRMLHDGVARRRIPLPTYPFQRQRHWIGAAASSPAKATSTALTKKPNVADWFYLPEWQLSPLEPLQDSAAPAAGWLIFADDCGLGDALAAHLRRTERRAIVVRPGRTFQQIDAQTYQLDPGARDDYVRLIEAARQDDLPTRIVHLWSVTSDTPAAAPSDPAARFEATQDRGFYSLLFLAQALAKAGLREHLSLNVISNHVQSVVGDELLDPDKATLIGPCKVIPQELLSIASRSIDIVLPASDAEHDALTELLLTELSAASSDSEIAYRAGTRWVKGFSASAGHTLPEGQSRLRPGGVYLITGGLGNLGLLLAEHLARTVQAKIVLLGRTALPTRETWTDWLRTHDDDDPISRKLHALTAIEAAGAELLIVRADVSDAAALRAAIATAEQRFGALHGVIHAAGITDEAYYSAIGDVERAECALHFQAKAHGLIALEQALNGRRLDFALLFSSLAAVLGGLSYVAYAAANVYLDAFARRQRQIGATPYISVNWDSWHERAVGDGALGVTLIELAIAPGEGLSAVQHVLSIDAPPQIVVSTSDLQSRLDQWIKLAALRDSSAADAGSQDRVLPGRAELQQRLVGIWQRVLGVSRIGLHDNFFDLGGNSLSGMQMIAELKRELDVQLSPVTLFEAPSISALVKLLSPEQTAAPPRHEQAVRAADRSGDMAIIGMNGRFPGAKNLQEFWRNLRDGIESVTYFSDDELSASVPPALRDDPSYVKARPILEGIELFDAAFFGYTPREAELMDPQHRLFLECAWEALELSGYSNERYPGAIGVFAGASLSTYLLNLYSNADLIATVDPLQTVIGNAADSLTTSVSYKLNLTGPSLAVQTFCSTSLVAVHLACQSIARGECDLALAGGSSILTPQHNGYRYQEGGILSPDGHSRPFDANAGGTVFGNGVGVVVLKRLADALQDGDTIHAVIRGSAINNDGALKVGYTAPSVDGQAAVIAAALAAAAVDPATIGYVEAHGTGTALGDPIEVAALTKAYRPTARARGQIALGSVKSNIGHLDRAAGVAALIKTVLALTHEQLPPSLHFTQPNPKIDFASSPFYVNSSLRPWPRTDAPRRAGVSALGFGGTNAHVILEEAPAPLTAVEQPTRRWQLLQLSAKTAAALDAQAANLAAHLRQRPTLELADLSYTLQVGRHSFNHRLALLCETIDEAVTALETRDQQRMLSAVQETNERPVAFLFPGQGAQSVGMGREVYAQEPVFRATVDRCARLLEAHLGLDLRTVLYPAPDQTAAAAAQLQQTALAQPALFVVEYALAQLWQHWGVTPTALLGHSLGEVVAATLAGVFTLEDALALVAERGRLMQTCAPGAMLGVALPAADLDALLGPDLSLAALNTPTQTVVAGSEAAIEQLRVQLERADIRCRRLPSAHAFHSPAMEPILPAFRAAVARVARHAPQRPFLSNVTGAWITAAEATDPDYWTQQLRQPVRFAAGLAALAESESILLEVGPGTTLSTFARQQLASDAPPVVLHSLRPPQQGESDSATLLTTAGKLWLSGLTLNWAAMHEPEQRRRIPLPTYPFERQRYWIEPGAADAALTQPNQQRPVSQWFYTPTWTRSRTPKPTTTSDQPQTWLIFADETGLGATVGQLLRRDGHAVIMIVAGAQFERQDDHTYRLNPSQRDGYLTLLRELERRPTTILHCWGIDEQTAVNQERGLFSLLALAQAIAALSPAEPLPLWALADSVHDITGAEQLRPEQACLLAACKALNQEPMLLCRCIELALPGPGKATLAMQIAAEISGAAPEWQIAYRGRHRWTAALETLTPAVDRRAALPLREDGVYLITAALDQPTIQFAEHLALAAQPKLLLLDRDGLPDRAEWADWLDGSGPSAGRKQAIVERIIAQQRLPIDLAAERDELDRLAAELDQQHHTSRRPAALEPLSDQLCASYIYHYFAQQIEIRPGATFSRAELQQRLGILPTFDRLFAFMLSALEQERIIACAGDHLTFVGSAPAPDGLRNELSRRFPEARQSFAVLDHCIRSYSQALSGALDPIGVLYPNGESEMMRAIETNQLQFSNLRACRALAAQLVARIAAQLPHRTLRILEVGAGEGQLTWELAALLRDRRVDYHFTDVGRSFLLAAEKRAAAQGYAFMRFGLLDIARDPLTQGFEALDYDVIVAGEALHTTPDIAATLAHLQRLLRPHGVLAILEATSVQRWAHLVWGLLDGWWRFDDTDLRQHSPLLSGDTWARVLQQAGFAAIAQYPAADAARQDADYRLLIAQQPPTLSRDGRPWLDDWREQTIERLASRIGRAETLARLGAEVLTAPATLDDPAQVRAAIAMAQERWGALHGVIHALDWSYAPPQPIREIDRADYARALQPAAAQFAGLTEALADTSLEVALLISAPVVASAAPAALPAAAVSLMLEAQALSDPRAPRWTVVNWAAAADQTQIGAQAFRQIFATDAAAQMVVLPQPPAAAWNTLAALKASDGAASRPPIALHARPTLHTAYVAPTGELELQIAQVWGETLGIAQIGIHDSFLDLGGDSLQATQLLSRLRDVCAVELPLSAFFEAPTIAGLAQAVEAERSAQADDETEEILALLAQLSDEEVLAEIQKRQLLLDDSIGR